jgi:mRNA interferase MazF
MTLARGDLVSVRARGAYTEEPRPALVVQSTDAVALRESVTICLLTGELIEASSFRIRILPDASNGLRKPSDVMIDKVLTVPKSTLGTRAFGKLSAARMADVDRALRFWLGL